MKSSCNQVRSLVPGLLILTLCVALVSPIFAQSIPPDPQIPSKQLISPEELNQMLKMQKPLVLSIGPRSLYDQAHIPGAEFIGGASTPEGLDALKTRLKSEPKNKLIVLYCGCCPWNHCPNVHPAYRELRNLGYTNVRVLYIADNFGTNWVNKGYPTTRG